MAEIADAFTQWMRDYVTDGVPGSGINPPSKAEGRAIGALIEAYIDAKVIDLVNTILGAPPATPGPYVMPAYATSGGVDRGTTAAAAPWPAVLADDIALLQVESFERVTGTSAYPVRPAGWTQIGATVAEGAAKAALYWKRCDGSETGSVTVLTDGTGGGSSPVCAANISTWRGCVANGDPYEALDTNHGPGPSMPSRAVTTTGPSRLVVNLWNSQNVGGAVSSGPDTGFTEVFELSFGAQPTVFIADVQTAALASTVGVDTRALTSGEGWACFSLALLPSS